VRLLQVLNVASGRKIGDAVVPGPINAHSLHARQAMHMLLVPFGLAIPRFWTQIHIGIDFCNQRLGIYYGSLKAPREARPIDTSIGSKEAVEWAVGVVDFRFHSPFWLIFTCVQSGVAETGCFHYVHVSHQPYAQQAMQMLLVPFGLAFCRFWTQLHIGIDFCKWAK
jgi:hypothetical protein